MTLDEAILRDVQTARENLEQLEDATYEARACFHQAIRRLHGAGGSMREIATALGLSHQRVHQIVGEDGIVELEAASTELTPLPTAGAVVTTGQQDRCSFCAAGRSQLDQFLAAPGGVFICGGCVVEASRVVQGGSSATLAPADAGATCTFCRNDTTMGPGASSGEVNICASCVATCERMLTGPRPRKVMARRNARFRCSFCNGAQPETKRLITGPGVFICNACVAAAGEVLGSGQPTKGPRQVVLRDATEQGRPCQFCGKLPAQVGGMVSGGRGRICQPCLHLCQEMLASGA
ncbi:MAG: hypothetical protein KY439_06270 [Actinobacteria bacterium]|nr:hypothetical protein [Actinomycetota bacterium]